MFPSGKDLGCRLTYLVGLCVAIGGCGELPGARYVYQDADFGVIGIPQNTCLGNIDYRSEAERLMSRDFPEGYEIVRAEEVVEGQTTREITKKTEVDADPNFLAMNQRLKLGKLGRTTSYDEKDQLPLRECRIIYKKKPVGTSGRSGQFAMAASAAPPFYVDPNEAIRHPPRTPMLAKVSPMGERGSVTKLEESSDSAFR